jgi:hypothetical protein
MDKENEFWTESASGSSLSRSKRELRITTLGVLMRNSRSLREDASAALVRLRGGRTGAARSAGEQVAAPQVAAPVRNPALVPLTPCLASKHRLPATLGELFRWALAPI